MIEILAALAEIKEAVVSSGELIKESIETAIEENPLDSVSKEIENFADLKELKEHNEERLRNNEIKISQIMLNRENGDFREVKAFEEIKKEFLESEGYKYHQEMYLRDKEGNILKDIETGEARRVDIMVEKDGMIFKSYEITSESAPKEMQIAKEERIREAGGNFIKDRETGKLLEIPKDVKTEIRRYK